MLSTANILPEVVQRLLLPSFRLDVEQLCRDCSSRVEKSGRQILALKEVNDGDVTKVDKFNFELQSLLVQSSDSKTDSSVQKLPIWCQNPTAFAQFRRWCLLGI